MADAPPAPKLELKMFLPLILLFFSKKIDLKDPDNLRYAHIALATAFVVVLSIYLFVWFSIQRKKDTRDIWIPPKAPPQIPFLTNPNPEPAKPHEKTTYEKHEEKLVKELVQGALLQCGIAAFMSFKFNIHISCMMQAVMLPLGVFDAAVCKKHLGFIDSSQPIYNELLTAPTASPIAKADEDKAKEKKWKKPPKIEEVYPDTAEEQNNSSIDSSDIHNID